MKNADGREDGQHVMLFSSQAIQEHPAIGLSHAGFILIGLMNGGDYDTVSMVLFSLNIRPSFVYTLSFVFILRRAACLDVVSRSHMLWPEQGWGTVSTPSITRTTPTRVLFLPLSPSGERG